MGGSILVVEHDAATRELIAANLRSAGYQVALARDFLEAEPLVQRQRPDAALLDWAPGAPALLFTRQLRADRRTARVSIMLLSARPEEENTVAALECGADDCMSRNVSMRELLARVKAVLRRRSPERTDELIELNGLRIDPAVRSVVSNGRDVELSRTEFALLLYFVTHPGWTLSRRKLLDEVWGEDVYVEERTVDVHVRRLRRLLAHEHGKLIETMRGQGYRWRTRPEPTPAPALYSAISSLVGKLGEFPELPSPVSVDAA